MIKKFYSWLVGNAKDPLSEDIFHQLALVAFLAWAGLGADGLSSAAYGPEEAYRALGREYSHLAIYLGFATAITVFIISASYNQIIELFPSGGGGYVVASKLLGKWAGLTSGSALVVDYILTISISIAAGVDALFSIFQLNEFRLAAAVILVIGLTMLNLRGIKESIKFLMPIFLLFVFSHLVLIFLGIYLRMDSLPNVFQASANETKQLLDTRGFFAMVGLMLTAYSMGGGTYTGIEAVSNGLAVLREPRAKTGRRTMLYMAVSLSIAAGGILLLYMLWDTQPQAGSTMNALLINQVFGPWNPGGLPLGRLLVILTLISEGAILFIAAQAGFVDGPNVLASMAVDSWLPHRFANLSNRLVRKNGILLMGVATLGILYLTSGKVDELVVLYSINVFVTFSLSQLSMCRHWLEVRHEEKRWRSRFAINGLGLLLTLCILISTVVIKFKQGGWVTMVITGGLIGLCAWIKYHYEQTNRAMRRLDEMLEGIPQPEIVPTPKVPNFKESTAALLVNDYSGLGIHALYSIRKIFRGGGFQNIVFISVGRIDSDKFKGLAEIGNLKKNVVENLEKYVKLAQSMGYASEYRFALGTDVISEVCRLSEQLSRECDDLVIFSGKLIFSRETFLNRILHSQTSTEIQRQLFFRGMTIFLLPIRVL